MLRGTEMVGRYIDVWNDKSGLKASPDMTLKIQTDTSKTSWGAHWESIKNLVLWIQSEKTPHIKAILFALMELTENNSNCRIPVKVNYLGARSRHIEPASRSPKQTVLRQHHCAPLPTHPPTPAPFSSLPNTLHVLNQCP